MKLTILGSGAWGTALGIVFAQRHEVILWGRDVDQIAILAKARMNSRYLAHHSFPDGLNVSSDLKTACDRSELIILATPIAGLRPTLQALAALSMPLAPLLSVCKGFEAGSSLLVHQVLADVFADTHPLAILSGPSFAHEVAQGLPAALSLAAHNSALAQSIVQQLHTPTLRLYANDDLVGVEVGGAVKNVMAIATGVADGLELGLNARAALMTRGLNEMAHLALALGAQANTLMGLSGIGDLILTCTGALSRNRTVGLQLAKGLKLPGILNALGHVAEGVSTAREVLVLANRLQLDMPICSAVCRLLYEEAAVKDVLTGLLSREPKNEFKFPC